MTFNINTDLNYAAYVYARGLVASQDVANWDVAFNQSVMNSATAGATLVTNSGTAAAPNGTIATWIAQANASYRVGNRDF